jgi:hypothetical protein
MIASDGTVAMSTSAICHEQFWLMLGFEDVYSPCGRGQIPPHSSGNCDPEAEMWGCDERPDPVLPVRVF